MLFSTYDAAADFSTTANPSGVWSYGVRFTEFADFAQFPVSNGLDFAPNSTLGWNENSGSPPYVGINTTNAEVDSNGVDLPTGVLVMHPGGNGEYSDTRFTVPTAGDLTVNFNFEGIDTSNTTTDVHVLYNNASVFDGAIDQFQQSVTTEPPLTIPNAAAGGTIDFVVGPGSNGTFGNDATSLSAQITTGVANDHLVFTRQPRDGDTNSPVPTQVKVVDSHNRIDKSVPDGVNLLLNVPAGSTATIINAPFVYAAFVNGVATFASLNAPFIDTAGTYTVTAVADDGSGEQFGTAGVDTAVSQPFKIAAPHLVFTKQPKDVVLGEPIPFAVELLDSKNKPVQLNSGNTPQLGITLEDSLDYGEPEVELQVPLQGGKYDNLQPPSGNTPLTFDRPSTFTINVYADYRYGLNGLVDTPVADNIESMPFKIVAPHLVFTKQPKNIAIGDPISFAVALLDLKNKVVALNVSGTPQLGILLLDSTNTDGSVVEMQSPFPGGRYDNLQAAVSSTPLMFDQAGTYIINVYANDQDGTVQTPVTDNIESKAFTIVADHLTFTRQPQSAAANTPLDLTIAVRNFRNQPVALSPFSDDILLVGLNQVSGTGTFSDTPNAFPVAQIYTNTYFDLGTFNNRASDNVNMLQISANGTYSLTVSVLSNNMPVPDYEPVTSKNFKIVG